MIRRLRRLAARSPLLFEIASRLRSRSVVRDYVARRERYVRAGGGPLSRAGADEARRLLGRRWSGPRRILARAGDARIFFAVPERELAAPIGAEIRRSFSVQHFDVAPYLPDPRDRRTEWRDRLQREMLEAFIGAHAKEPFDLALLYLNHYHVAPATLRAMEGAGVPVATLSLDDKHTWEQRPGPIPSGKRPIAAASTVNLTSSIECLRWYAAEGAVGYYFPEGADPEIYRHLDTGKDIDVSFVGGWYGARRTLISNLRALGIRIECFGPETEHGPVSRDDMVKIFNRSRVNLGFGGIGETGEITHLKGRDFEIPMTGNAYLTLFDHELARLYDVGDEIACYRNEIDCAEQIRMLLDDPVLLERMGSAARARALADHTWTRRVEDLLRWMGIIEESER